MKLSPQPHVPLEFGFLKTNLEANLSSIQSISLPMMLNNAFESMTILTPSCSTTSSNFPGSVIYCRSYVSPEHPRFLALTLINLGSGWASSALKCLIAFGLRVISCLSWSQFPLSFLGRFCARAVILGYCSSYLLVYSFILLLDGLLMRFDGLTRGECVARPLRAFRSLATLALIETMNLNGFLPGRWLSGETESAAAGTVFGMNFNLKGFTLLIVRDIVPFVPPRQNPPVERNLCASSTEFLLLPVFIIMLRYCSDRLLYYQIKKNLKWSFVRVQKWWPNV